jgi:putative Ca2+/H+ antiporter (TMEM165/GDT1 family)
VTRYSSIYSSTSESPQSVVGFEVYPVSSQELAEGAIAAVLIQEDEVPATLADPSPANPSNSQIGWKVFATTFATVFLAELGDKTQVSTLLMTAESHSPWVVFTGAATALIATSLLGVLIGRWLSSRVSAKTLDTAAGVMLALISVWLFWDVLK